METPLPVPTARPDSLNGTAATAPDGSVPIQPSATVPAPIEEGPSAVRLPIDLTHPALQHAAIALTAAVASVYGLGYSIQYAANLRLGVGPLAPSRESAVGTGLGFLLFLAPCIMPVLLYRRSLAPRADTARGTVGAGRTGLGGRIAAGFLLIGVIFLIIVMALVVVLLVTVLQVLCGFTLLAEGSGPVNLRDLVERLSAGPLGFSLIVVWMLGLLRLLRATGRLGKERDWWVMEAGALAVTLPLLIHLYARGIAPYLEPTFGGYVLAPVREVAPKGKPKPVRLLVVSDANTAVFADAGSAREFWLRFRSRQESASPLRIERRRWEGLGSLERVGAGAPKQGESAASRLSTSVRPSDTNRSAP